MYWWPFSRQNASRSACVGFISSPCQYVTGLNYFQSRETLASEVPRQPNLALRTDQTGMVSTIIVDGEVLETPIEPPWSIAPLTLHSYLLCQSIARPGYYAWPSSLLLLDASLSHRAASAIALERETSHCSRSLDHRSG